MRRWLTVAGVLAAVGAVVVLLLPGSGGDVEPVRDEILGGSELIDALNSPALARDPTDPDRLALVYRQDRPTFDAFLRHSQDGGETWGTTGLPLPEGLDRPFAPSAAFGPEGTLYVSYVNLTGPGNVPQNLWLARSDDGGQTLTDRVKVAGELAFQAQVVVGPEGAVHLTWMQAAAVGLFKLTEGPNPIVAVRSTDGGESFSDPVQVSDADRQRVGAGVPVVDAEGNLVVVYTDFKDDRRDFENLEGPPWPDPIALVATRSTDGGESFSEGVELDSGVILGERFLVFIPPFPGVAAGPDGEIVVAWSDARDGTADVFLRRSPDGGQSWGDRVRVHEDPQGTQKLPAVDVAPTGRIDVLYYDGEPLPDELPDDPVPRRTVLASSWNEGGSFASATVSSEDFDARVGPQAHAGLEPDFGSRLALSSTADGALASWTDTRRGDLTNGRQDIAVGAAEVEAPAGPPTALGVGLAVLAALLLAIGLLPRPQGNRAGAPEEDRTPAPPA